MDFPTLGLNFDLNSLVDYMRRMLDVKGATLDVGKAMERQGDQADEAGRKISGAGLAAEAAAFKAARANATQEQSVRALLGRLREYEELQRAIATAERIQKRADKSASIEKEVLSLKKLAQTIELVARDGQRAAAAEVQRWNRVADAIKMAADQTVRAGQADAEARVRITQAMIAQNRQAALTQESLTREALLVDRLTRELQELGQARAASARQFVAPGADAGLAGKAAAATVLPTIASAQSGLNDRARELAGLGDAYDRAGRKQSSFHGGIQKLGLSLASLRRFIFDARFAIGAFFAAITLGPLAALADQMVSLEARTRLYAKQASDVPFLLELTYQTAQRARAPLEGIATLYTRLAPLGDQLGRSQTQLLRVVETVAKAFAVGGAAASEATAGAQQFAQAIASNRFGGDELRSVAENAPILLKAIADGVNQLSKEGFAGIDKGLNLNAATFIKWAQQGNASAEVMVAALERSQEAIDKAFSSFPVTISQATAVVGNAFQRLVDEVDRRSGEAGQRLSTTIANALAGFGDFLTQKGTIDAIVGSIQMLKDVLSGLGTAAKTAVDYFPTLVTAVLAFVVASKQAMIVQALTAAMGGLQLATTAVGLAFTGATGRALLLSQAHMAVSNTAKSAMAAMGGVAGIITGGILIAITAAVYAWNSMANAQRVAAEASANYSAATEGALSAIERAIAFNELYKRNTDALTKAMREEAGMSADSASATDGTSAAHKRAAEMALIRANAERELTRAMLLRIATEAGKRADELDQSVNGFFGLQSQEAGLFYGGMGSPDNPAYQRRVSEARGRRLAAQFAAQEERDREARFTQLAAGMATPLTAADVTVPGAAGAGTGAGATDDKGKGMSGAINAVAKLRAEVSGLNLQIRELSVDPLSDVAAQIIAAGNAAAAERTAGKGNAFQDEAERLAMLKEEASIRLGLTRNLVEQERAARESAEATRQDMAANDNATRAMMDFYTQGERSSARYIQALAAQADAELAGQKSQAALRIAQKFGVTSLNDISEAYSETLEQAGLLTPETAAYAEALERQAKATYDAEAATLDLTEAQRRQEQFNNAALARQAEISNLEDYARALEGGTAALTDYNRQQAIRAALEAAGPVANGPFSQIKIIADVMKKLDVDYRVAVGERVAAANEQLRLATLTAEQREIEALAAELAQKALRAAATDADRAQAAIILATERAAKLKTEIQDSVRQAFIESGDLDFSSLQNGLKRSIRQALYDALIAKPVTIVVNAVVDMVTEGMNEMLALIKKWLGGTEDGSIFDALGKAFGEGGKINEWLKGLGDFGKSMAKWIPQLGNFVKGASTGYTVGSTISDMVGLRGAGDERQQLLDMGASAIGQYIGGPIGAAIATIASRVLGGIIFDKKRALAITALEVQGGRFVSKGTRGYDDGPTEEIDAAGKQLASLLNKVARAFELDLSKAEGLYTVFGWTQGENTKALGGEGFFGGMLNGISQLRGMSLDEIKGTALGRGVDLSQVKSAEDAIDRIMREMVIAIGDAQDVPFTEAEKALIRAADSLEEAAKTLMAARNIETNLQRALLQFTNPREFAIQNLRDQQIARRQEILDLVDQGLVTQDRLPGIEAMLRELERAELGDLLGRFAGGIDGAISSLEDLRKAQEKLAEYAQGLITGNLSPLSPSARLSASASEFQRLLALGNAGDADAIERLTGASTEYLSAAQRYFASSPEYAAIFDEVYQQLMALSEREFDDPLMSLLETEFQRLIDAINAGFLLIYDGTGGDGDTDPVLPDSPVLPGAGGGGGGGGGPPVDPLDWNNFTETMQDGFRSVNETLAGVAEAVVRSQDSGSTKVAEAAKDTPSFVNALEGGRTSQSRVAA